MSDLPPPPPPNMAPPPGYVAYGGGFGSPQGSFKRVGGLGKWVVALLGVAIASQILLVLVQVSLRNSARDFLDGSITSAAFDKKLAAYVGVGVLVGAAAIAQLVLLCIWTFRMAKNAQLLGRQPQKFSPGATIAINILGGCTLGILPFFMWRELWQASDPEVAPGDPSWKRSVVSALVPLHLAITLCSVVVSIIASRSVSSSIGFTTTGKRADIAKNISDRLAAMGVSGLLTVAGAVVFLMLVRQLTARHMRATHEA